MKPFNLERALAGEPVITRDGRPVKIAGYNEEADDDSKVALWIGGYVYGCSDSGIYNFIRNRESNFDLFMAPTERKEWIVRCVFGNDLKYLGPFSTEEAAIIYAADNNELRSVYEITIHE
jgi:hypothetical protein